MEEGIADSRRSSASSNSSFYCRNNQRLSISSPKLSHIQNHEEVNIIDLTSDDEGCCHTPKTDSDSPKGSEDHSWTNNTRRMSQYMNRKRKSLASFGSDLIHGGLFKDPQSKASNKQDPTADPNLVKHKMVASRSLSLSLKRNGLRHRNKGSRGSLPNVPYESPSENADEATEKTPDPPTDQLNSQTLVYSKPFDLFCKVLLLGDPGVGKTCLLLKYKDGAFLSGSYISTVGIDFRNKVISVDDSTVKLQIWDTAGQERFRSVTHAYYRDAHALLLLYDVMNKTSFDNTRGWLAEVKEYAQDDVVIMLIGNKCDIPASERQIRREDGERLAREYSVAFMETSAKTGLNVDLAFTAIAKDLKARKSGTALESRFNVSTYLKEEEKIDHCTCSLI